MALLQITEPGQAVDPHQRKRAAGIDLGTTNSLVAGVRGGVTDTLPDPDGNQPGNASSLGSGEHGTGTGHTCRRRPGSADRTH